MKNNEFEFGDRKLARLENIWNVNLADIPNDSKTIKEKNEFLSIGADNGIKSQLYDVLNKFEKSDEITEQDVNHFKNIMKDIEKKVKEKNKPKTVTISGKDHATIKKHCTNLNLNIGEWVTKVLLKEIEENSCIIYDNISQDDFVKSESKRILSDYENILSKYIFIKSNTMLNGVDFVPNGNSYVDNSFIYKVERESYDKITNELKARNIKIELIKTSENIHSMMFSTVPDTESKIHIEYFSKIN